MIEFQFESKAVICLAFHQIVLNQGTVGTFLVSFVFTVQAFTQFHKAEEGRVNLIHDSPSETTQPCDGVRFVVLGWTTTQS